MNAPTISEMFWSIQGEGISTGVPSLFIRFNSCNLCCGGSGGHLVKAGKATWHCDSEKVWRNSVPLDWEQLGQMIQSKWEALSNRTAHIIFTGGEPTLFPNYMTALQIMNKYPGFYYEIETNGSIDRPQLIGEVDQINTSPKLVNSGMPLELRYSAEAQQTMRNHHNAWWKFVISCEEDFTEAMDTYAPPLDRVILMPACDNRKDLPAATKMAWDVASKYGVRVCTRLHVLAFDQLTGV
jgi:7-carboxy-7-deazaguanine synthase